MPSLRSLSAALIIAAVAGSLAADVMAFDLADPFATEAGSPPQPRGLRPAESESAYTPCPPHADGASFSVLDVVDLALCQNPKTREAWANARVQAALTGRAQSAYLPTLDGRLSLNRTHAATENSTQASSALTLSWLLYDSGARAAGLENARQVLSAAASTLDASVQSVFLSALQSYYNAQAARATLSAAREAEKAGQASHAAAEVRYTVGTGTPADRLQAKTAWSQATLNRIKAEGVLRTAYGTLASVMGLEASQPLQLDSIQENMPEATFEHDVDALIAEARQRRPDFKAAEAQVHAARANIDVARASGQPTLSLSAGPAWQDTRGRSDITSHSSTIGLTLSLPLFSGFDTTYSIRAAQARAEVAGAQRDAVRQQIALDVWTAYQNLNTATQALRATIDLLASAEQSERVALGRYKAGVGTILDVLNAQSALAAARLQGIQARLDWNVSRAALAKAMGTLDAELLNPAAGTLTP